MVIKSKVVSNVKAPRRSRTSSKLLGKKPIPSQPESKSEDWFEQQYGSLTSDDWDPIFNSPPPKRRS